MTTFVVRACLTADLVALAVAIGPSCTVPPVAAYAAVIRSLNKIGLAAVRKFE